MNYPDEFDYFDTVSGMEYTTTPTGEMDINRLIQNKSYWIASTKKEKKHKHLVLTDWRARNWSFSKKEAVIDKLGFLLDKGFKIYVFGVDKLISISRKNLDYLLSYSDILAKIRPVYFDEVAKIAFAQYKIPAEHLHCLDASWVDCLIEGQQKPGSMIVEYEDLVHLSKTELEKLKDLLSKQKISQLSLFRDILSSFIQDFFKEHLPAVPQKVSNRTEYVSDLDNDIFNTEAFSEVEKLYLNVLFSTKKPPEQLRKLHGFSKLRSLCIHKALSEEYEINYLKSLQQIEDISLKCSGEALFKILDGLRNLKRLKFAEASMDSKAVPIFHATLSKLKHVEFRETPNMNFGILQNLLNAAPNMISLSATQMDIKGSIPLKCQTLSKLQILNLRQTILPVGSIHALLSACPTLRKLTISRLDPEPLSVNSLNYLEELFVFLGSTKDVQNLPHLMMASPNLKTLELHHCEFNDSVVFPKDFALNQLEELTIHSGEINFGMLVDLLNLTPNLKKISCSNLKILGEVQKELVIKSLLRVQECKLNGSKMTSEHLVILLKAMPNIKKLYLYENSASHMKIDLPRNHFGYLEGLTLSFSNFLPLFLKAAPHCKQLTLSSAEGDGLNCPKKLTLHSSEIFPTVEKLDISGEESVSSKVFEYLLKLFPNLKKLQLTETAVEGDKLDLLPGSLPNLSILEMDCNIKEKVLTSILKAAPRLDREDYEELIAEDSASESDEESEEDIASQFMPSEISECVWDADTRSTHPTYHIDQIFYPQGHEIVIPPSLYRINVFHHLELKKEPCGIQEAFRIIKVGDLNLVSIPDLKTMKLDAGAQSNPLYRGKKRIRLTKNWQPLPSISAKEQLIEYQIEPKVALEIQYSRRDSMYYVRHKETEENIIVAFEWVLSVPQLKAPVYSKPIQDLIVQMQSFKEGALTLTDKQLTGKDYISALIQQQKGACRHRSLVFKYLMHEKNPNIPVRIVQNDCHAYVEIGIDHQWFACDLGGYPANIRLRRTDSNALECVQASPRKPFKASEFDPDEFADAEIPAVQKQLVNALCQKLVLENRRQESDDFKNLSYHGHIFAFAEISLSPKRWQNEVLQPILQWDGSIQKLIDQVSRVLDVLYGFSRQYDYIRSRYFYLGDKLKTFLQNLNHSCILYNPWIACHIQRGDTPDEWFVFDGFGSSKTQVTQKELYQEVLNRLGPLVFIEFGEDVSLSVKDAPFIKDPNIFIEEGGLLCLPLIKNIVDVLNEWSQKPVNEFSEKVLQGLFLVGTNQIPAWVKGLANELTYHLTLKLLEQWIVLQKNDKDWESKLLDDLTSLDEEFKQPLLRSLKNNLQSETAPSIGLQKFYSFLTYADYDVHFKPRDVAKAMDAPKTWDTYCQQLLAFNPQCRKKLIELTSSQDVKGLRFGLEKIAKSSSRPLFYVHSAEDLVCMAPFIVRSKDSGGGKVQGILQKGPGGPLFDFLKAPHKAAPVLIVNYANFSAEEIVAFNELLDKKQMIQGIPVPDKSLVIGLLNIQKEGCYQGADFYSRFDSVESCKLSALELQKPIQEVNFIEYNPQASSKVPAINLFHHRDWKTKLLGSWVLSGNSLTYQAGLLPDLLSKSSVIEVQNGLWKSEEFQSFWQEAILRGEILHQGISYPLPSDFKMIKRETYDWDILKKSLHIQQAKNPKSLLLNPGTLSDYFSHYEFNSKTNSLERVPGFIELATATKNLCVYVSRELPDDDWARLLDECQRHGVVLKAELAANVLAPPKPLVLEVSKKSDKKPLNGDVLRTQKTLFIESTDVDVTVSMLTQDKERNFQVIDISECQAEHLLQHLQGTLNQETLRLEFSQSNGLLYDALLSSKNLILKGRFSSALIDKIGVKLLARMQEVIPKGQWILVTEQADSFVPFSSVHQHQVSVGDKLKLLQLTKEQENALGEDLLTKAPFSELQARICILNTRRISSDLAWEGMRELLPSNNNVIELPKDIASAAAVFTKARLNAVMAQLNVYPFVFLTGLYPINLKML